MDDEGDCDVVDDDSLDDIGIDADVDVDVGNDGHDDDIDDGDDDKTNNKTIRLLPLRLIGILIATIMRKIKN